MKFSGGSLYGLRPFFHLLCKYVINSNELRPRENDNCKCLFLLSSVPNYRLCWKLIDHRGCELRVHWLSKLITVTDDFICCRRHYGDASTWLSNLPAGGRPNSNGGHDSRKFITYQSFLWLISDRIMCLQWVMIVEVNWKWGREVKRFLLQWEICNSIKNSNIVKIIAH